MFILHYILEFSVIWGSVTHNCVNMQQLTYFWRAPCSQRLWLIYSSLRSPSCTSAPQIPTHRCFCVNVQSRHLQISVQFAGRGESVWLSLRYRLRTLLQLRTTQQQHSKSERWQHTQTHKHSQHHVPVRAGRHYCPALRFHGDLATSEPAPAG